MIVHRLCKAAHAALDGEGARMWGGRWNSPGRAMVYTAATPSLAVLEVLVHLDLPPDLIPDDMVLLAIDVPNDATLHNLDSTPTDADACRQAGDAFLDASQALGLRVRSVVVPQEANLLLNVRHADMTRVRVVGTDSFRFDPRLLR
ncbi:RES family NAD+ phosphorylase [Sphingomonas melonis]